MRVLVVDDVAVHRTALAECLGREPAIAAVLTAADSVAALRHLAAVARPSVVILNMATRGSLPILRRLGAAVPVIALAVTEAEEEIIACAEAGAAGFLFREQPLIDLLALLESVARGETRYSPSVAATLLRHVGRLTVNRRSAAPAARLTPREREVLELIEQGLSNKQIARRLSIELRTAKNHVHHILEKYQVHRRADAAERYRRSFPEPARL
ncbi:response regulator transcription factor [Actinoplanes sp. NPDC048967]|uniref:response regulator transcription factor n=1 Tax=Actinoplanes sp. NPDC048967 TaxID=3155269 RepID=UPI0033C1A54E